MITVLVYYDRISLFHTLTPFFLKKYRDFFHFTQSVDYCLRRDRNKVLWLERQFQHSDPRDLEKDDVAVLRKLRDKYEKIIFLNGKPEAGTNRLDVLPFVDRFFDKSVFSNYDHYKEELYGKNLFADYYHRKYGATDSKEYIFKKNIDETAIKRIELSWNIGVGVYPRWNRRQRIGAAIARADFPGVGRLFNAARKPPSDFSSSKRSVPVHARFVPVFCPSIAYQRTLFLEKIKTFEGAERKKSGPLFLTGMARQKQYYHELTDSKIVLSPFGWGEVCHRDFEAIMAGALLLKPDMSHLKTYPDVYLPNETYVPVDWDGDDLFEKVKYYLANEKERSRIARNAYEQYEKDLSSLEERFMSLFGSLFDFKT
ncbi:MAG: glycosyltransferase [Treponema sp.]|jgi:hypothetical protein|nr:glycosyltransferase [Treponema sp.]